MENDQVIWYHGGYVRIVVINYDFE